MMIILLLAGCITASKR